MAKLIKPDGSMTDVDSEYEEGFLPSEIVARLGGDQWLVISLNAELVLIVARDHAGLPLINHCERH